VILADFQIQILTVNLSFPMPTNFSSIPALSINNWIVIQQRISLNYSFGRNWSEYKDGFGQISGGFWMGNDKIYALTQNGTRPYRLRIEMLSLGNKWRSGEYSSFSIDNEPNFYTLDVGSYSGDTGDALQSITVAMQGYQNGMKFSTYDRDNDDSPSFNCALKYGNGGFWWNNCWQCCLNCDGNSFAWFKNPPSDYYLQASRMMIKYI